MTDRLHISIILFIILVVLAIICFKTGDTFVAALAYIVGWSLMAIGWIRISKWLDGVEEEENSKPL